LQPQAGSAAQPHEGSQHESQHDLWQHIRLRQLNKPQRFLQQGSQQLGSQPHDGSAAQQLGSAAQPHEGSAAQPHEGSHVLQQLWQRLWHLWNKPQQRLRQGLQQLGSQPHEGSAAQPHEGSAAQPHEGSHVSQQPPQLEP
jgi:hypothetical protein